jgi:hypothetical protein
MNKSHKIMQHNIYLEARKVVSDPITALSTANTEILVSKL